MSLYETLGVSKNASPSEIKSAYRKLAHKNHPDKGGSVEKFQVIQHAYDILSDPEKRKRYDETGAETGQQTPQSLAIQQLASLFMQIVESCNPERTDILKRAKDSILAGEEKRKGHVQELAKKQRKYEGTLKRLKSKKKDHDFLAVTLRAAIQNTKAALEEAESMKKVGEEMLKLLKEYKYQFEEGADDAQYLHSFLQMKSTW